jgi:hypothetical protein
MTLEELLHTKREEIQRIAAKHGVYNLSVARREARAERDIDLLVGVGPATSSWFPAGLILHLEDLLSALGGGAEVQ